MAFHNPFRLVMPLQHMAKVKIIETIWRTSDCPTIAKDCPFSRPWNVGESAMAPMMAQFREYIDLLFHHYPHNLEDRTKASMCDELMVYALPMIQNALEFLIDIYPEVEDFMWQKDDVNDMFEYFIYNFTWDNMGCPDGRQMLKSWVSDKDTIHIVAWKLLCAYCIEDDIVKFAMTMNWEKYREDADSRLCSYWYRRVFGKPDDPSPDAEAPDAAAPDAEAPDAEAPDAAASPDSDESDDEDHLAERIFTTHRSRFRATPPALRYLRQELDAGHFKQLLNRVKLGFQHTDSVHLHLLGEIQDEDWLSSTQATKFIYDLADKWPLCLFTKHWVGVLEDRQVTKDQFLDIVTVIRDRLKYKMKSYRESDADKRNQVMVEQRTIYEPFEQLLEVFNRKCWSSVEKADYLMMQTTWFELGCIPLCRAMFEVEGSGFSRQDFLEHLKGHTFERHVLKELTFLEFYRQFAEQVLVNEEERKVFQELVDEKLFVSPFAM